MKETQTFYLSHVRQYVDSGLCSEATTGPGLAADIIITLFWICLPNKEYEMLDSFSDMAPVILLFGAGL